ncbi:MAG TPA: NYN domain-containing protein [Candidatus Limnocylindrales bacterium]|nr:NYN domain-containing protein [Candidatus Limnocylindrales bacterium]
MAEESLIAVFVDFENLAIGSRDMHEGEFRIDLVHKRLLEKGRLVFKRAYCDWNRYRGAVRGFHSQGIEMIDIPSNKLTGKNSADIRMVVDALDLCYSKDHIDVFALLTGDSDFSPLVNKLKENNKRVIGCGVRSSTSELLVSSCDEFIYYDDLVQTADKIRTVASARRASRSTGARTRGRASTKTAPVAKESAAPLAEVVVEAAAEPVVEAKPAKRSRTTKASTKATSTRTARGRRSKKSVDAEAEAVTDTPVEPETETTTTEAAHDNRAEGIDKLLEIVTSLSQDYDPVWGSLVKQTLRRVHPDFREEHYGYASFVEMLKDAEARSLVTLEYDQARGNYKIRIRS